MALKPDVNLGRMAMFKIVNIPVIAHDIYSIHLHLVSFLSAMFHHFRGRDPPYPLFDLFPWTF